MPTASADQSSDLQEQGEQLARTRRYIEATAAFKQADRLHANAIHACLIALAYARRELLPQAEVYLGICRERATEGEPLPPWLPDLEAELSERFSRVAMAPVAIDVAPTGSQALVTISSFAADDQFSPRTVHLPYGSYVVTVTAPGFDAAHQTIEIVDSTPRRVVVVLKSWANPSAPVHRHSRIPWVVGGAGTAIAAIGAVVHAFVLRPSYNKLIQASHQRNAGLYDATAGTFESERKLTIGLYATGVAVMAAGLILHYTVFKDRSDRVSVTAAATRGGGIVTIGW